MEVDCWLVLTEWRPYAESASCYILPSTIKSRRSFLLAPAHPGGPRKRAVQRLWWSKWVKTGIVFVQQKGGVYLRLVLKDTADYLQGVENAHRCDRSVLRLLRCIRLQHLRKRLSLSQKTARTTHLHNKRVIHITWLTENKKKN